MNPKNETDDELESLLEQQETLEQQDSSSQSKARQKQQNTPNKRSNIFSQYPFLIRNPELVAFIVFILIIIISITFSYNRNNSSSMEINQVAGNTNISAMPIAFQANSGLTQIEYEHLVYMREEEKLARDVYRYLYNKWKLSIFNSISQSEQRHTDSLAQMLAFYNIADPALNLNPGEFKDPRLSQLYQDLISKGGVNTLEALKVGTLIEELDIKDLDTAINQTQKNNLRQVYNNIRRGSYHHLRAFVHALELSGQTFEPSILDKARVSNIVNSPMGFPIQL